MKKVAFFLRLLFVKGLVISQSYLPTTGGTLTGDLMVSRIDGSSLYMQNPSSDSRIFTTANSLYLGYNNGVQLQLYSGGLLLNGNSILHASNYNLYSLPLTGGTLTGMLNGTSASFNGNIRSKKIIVTQNGWADYVFNDGYRLRPLTEIESFIKENKHLPEVPTAKEVEKNGVDLGETQALLLKKIEELTLYMIEMKKENEKAKIQLQKENSALKQRIEKLENKR